MRKYLATIHEKPDKHKKRFALFVSGSFTLSIFMVWYFVNFGLPAGQSQPSVAQESTRVAEVTPFGSMSDGVAAAWKALTGGFTDLKQGLQQVDVTGEYEMMRNRAFDNYGR